MWPLRGRAEQGTFTRLSARGRQATYPGQLFRPASAGASSRWPLIVALHGSGERGSDGERQLDIGLAPIIREQARSFPALALFPQVPELFAADDVCRAVITMVDHVIERYHADPARVHLTGLSLGGELAYELSRRYPDRFASLAPVCADVIASWMTEGEAHLATSDAHELLASTIKGIPTWAFQGALDSVIPTSHVRSIIGALRHAGGNVRYTEYPEAGHAIWDRAYREPELLPWMLAQHR